MTQLENHWLLRSARKILSLFAAKEVKTPLSFFHRLTNAIVALAMVGVLLLPPKERFELFIGAGSILFFLAVIIGVITWSKPKNWSMEQQGIGDHRRRRPFPRLAQYVGRKGPLRDVSHLLLQF